MHELAFSQYYAIAAFFSLSDEKDGTCQHLCHQTCAVKIMCNTGLRLGQTWLTAQLAAISAQTKSSQHF